MGTRATVRLLVTIVSLAVTSFLNTYVYTKVSNFAYDLFPNHVVVYNLMSMLPHLLFGYALTFTLSKFLFKFKRYVRWCIMGTIIYVLGLQSSIWYIFEHGRWIL